MTRDSRRNAVRPSAESAAWLATIYWLVVAPVGVRLRADDGDRPPLPPRALIRLGTNDLRTRDRITDVAFSPDGRFIAAAEGGTNPSSKVSLFDIRTGRQVVRMTLPEPDAVSVCCLAFSPDGTKLAWGEREGEVALWDLPGNRLIRRARLHDRTVNAVAFSPDGKLVASGDADGVVRVRLVERPADVGRRSRRNDGPADPRLADRTLRDRDSLIHSLAFTPDGTRLIAGVSSQETILVWSLADGELLRRIPWSQGMRGAPPRPPGPRFVAVTPDGRRILSSGYRNVPIGQTRVRFPYRQAPIAQVRSWDIATGERILDLSDDAEMSYGRAALSTDGRRIALAGAGAIKILDAGTGRPELRIELPGCSEPRPAFSPDGSLVAMPVENVLHVFEVSSGRRRLQDERTPAGLVRSAAWSPAGDRIVTAHGDGIVRVWDAASGRLIWHQLLTSTVAGVLWNGAPILVAFTRDGSKVVAAGQRNDPIENRNAVVVIFEAGGGRVLQSMTRPEMAHAALSDDDRMIAIAVGHRTSRAHLVGIEAGSGRERWTTRSEKPTTGLAPVAGMHSRASSPFLEVALTDGHIIRLNALTGRELRRFRVDGRPPEERDALPDRPTLSNPAFSLDGRTLAATARDWIYVWDVESGGLRRAIHLAHEDGCSLAIAPDGQTLAIGTGPYPEDAVRLVDIPSGAERIVLRPVDESPRLMTFSPDGTRLFTGVDRGLGLVWDVRLREDGAGSGH